MNREEELAKRYLESIGLSRLVHEPDGCNATPDFLADGRIGVEVRRLNQNEVTMSGKVRGLEDLRFALNRCMGEVLQSLGSPKNNRSWFVHFSFSRPVLRLPRLKNEVQKALQNFDEDQPGMTRLFITENFELEIIPSCKTFPSRFVPGGCSDGDTGGWLANELQKNIEICIAEKTAKIATVRNKYPEWWLILVDQIGYGIKESVKITHDLDRVILINPMEPVDGYDV